MNVSPALTSRRSERPVRDRPHLTGSVERPGCLSVGDRDQMFALLETNFSGANRRVFETDLAEKDFVIVLRDASSGCIQGFSTLMLLRTRVDDRELAAFFSGDTIVDRTYWGETILSRIWAQVVFAEADRLVADRPSLPLFWFLICSGYKTWRFLPLFFRQFYPNPAGPTPAPYQRILDALGTRKFGEQYCAGSGIVRLRTATPLRAGVADPEERLHDPLVAFFTRMNPGHAGGDELACLAELSRANLTRAAQRMLARPGID